MEAKTARGSATSWLLHKPTYVRPDMLWNALLDMDVSLLLDNSKEVREAPRPWKVLSEMPVSLLLYRLSVLRLVRP
jgi:hypothetical protein